MAKASRVTAKLAREVEGQGEDIMALMDAVGELAAKIDAMGQVLARYGKGVEEAMRGVGKQPAAPKRASSQARKTEE